MSDDYFLFAVYGDRALLRANEWGNRHFWRVSNAEHLKMAEDVAMINISHCAEFDVQGPDAADLLEYICVAKVGGDTPPARWSSTSRRRGATAPRTW